MSLTSLAAALGARLLEDGMTEFAAGEPNMAAASGEFITGGDAFGEARDLGARAPRLEAFFLCGPSPVISLENPFPNNRAPVGT